MLQFADDTLEAPVFLLDRAECEKVFLELLCCLDEVGIHWVLSHLRVGQLVYDVGQCLVR